MNVKLCDFSKDFDDTPLKEELSKVLIEYKRLGVDLCPKVWFSTDWFCPDGVNGFAVPFYLTSLSLMKKLDSLGVRVEGKTKAERAKLFRHELAHVMDNVYGLRRLKKRQRLFGLSSDEYPKSFRPKPNSRCLNHLDSYYWQAHPCEDWAESVSFVVDSLNRNNIRDLKEDEKFRYIIEVFNSINDQKPKRLLKSKIEDISTFEISLKKFIRMNQEKKISINKSYLLKGSVRINEKLLKKSRKLTKYPWVLDNLNELTKYRKSNLGLETSMSKRCWIDLLNGRAKALGVSGLNRIYM
ncbi:MAG: hypothetical protein CME61_06600 [Halobacteriovoraceae bacterium]|nr:hypothetical protein [Halobacteriovoraceae bacterium]